MTVVPAATTGPSSAVDFALLRQTAVLAVALRAAQAAAGLASMPAALAAAGRAAAQPSGIGRLLDLRG